MNEIISTLAFVGLSVAALATIGWYAMPRAERVAPTEVSLREWATITAHGARVLATWGPRLDFSSPHSAAVRARQVETSEL